MVYWVPPAISTTWVGMQVSHQMVPSSRGSSGSAFASTHSQLEAPSVVRPCVTSLDISKHGETTRSAVEAFVFVKREDYGAHLAALGQNDLIGCTGVEGVDYAVEVAHGVADGREFVVGYCDVAVVQHVRSRWSRVVTAAKLRVVQARNTASARTYIMRCDPVRTLLA